MHLIYARVLSCSMYIVGTDQGWTPGGGGEGEDPPPQVRREIIIRLGPRGLGDVETDF